MYICYILCEFFYVYNVFVGIRECITLSKLYLTNNSNASTASPLSFGLLLIPEIHSELLRYILI